MALAATMQPSSTPSTSSFRASHHRSNSNSNPSSNQNNKSNNTNNRENNNHKKNNAGINHTMSSLSLSHNGGNAGGYSYSDSPLTQLPAADFNFEDLRRCMADFTVRFDAFIEKGRKRVLEERNEFRGRLGEIAESQTSTAVQIQTLKSSMQSHNSQLSREEAEKSEIQTQISSLTVRLSNTQAHRDKLRTQIATTQRAIDAKITAQRDYADKIDSQSRLNGPELCFWESYLGCRIEGAAEDGVHEDGAIGVVFVFPPAKISTSSSSADTSSSTRINNTANIIASNTSEKEREASFSLFVPDSTRGRYKVLATKPVLDAEKVRRVEDRLNQTREIGSLLKGMRTLFQESLGCA